MLDNAKHSNKHPRQTRGLRVGHFFRARDEPIIHVGNSTPLRPKRSRSHAANALSHSRGEPMVVGFGETVSHELAALVGDSWR